MLKLTFRIRRDAGTALADFTRAVIESGDQLRSVPRLDRYVQHFAPSHFEDGVDGYLELWLDEAASPEQVLRAPGIQSFLGRQAPFWLEPMREDVA